MATLRYPIAKGTAAMNVRDITNMTGFAHAALVGTRESCASPRIPSPYSAPVAPLTNHKLCCFVTAELYRSDGASACRCGYLLRNRVSVSFSGVACTTGGAK